LVVLFDYNIETGFNIHRYELIWRIWEWSVYTTSLSLQTLLVVWSDWSLRSKPIIWSSAVGFGKNILVFSFPFWKHRYQRTHVTVDGVAKSSGSCCRILMFALASTLFFVFMIFLPLIH
jgi:hypothetical protein